MKSFFLLTATIFLFAGCSEAEFGERCDGFFSNGCSGLNSCVELEEGAVCTKTCTPCNGMNEGRCGCADDYSCEMTSYDGLASGSYCIPDTLPEN